MNFARFIPNLGVIRTITPLVFRQPVKLFHALIQQPQSLPSISSPAAAMSVIVRNKGRCYFPRPNERMRVRKHGWKHRMSTPEGRRVLMNRILKGRHVYSH